MRHQVLQKRITDGQQHLTKYDLNLSSSHWSPANKAPLPLTKFTQRTAMIPVLLYFASSIMKSEPQHYQKHSVPGICNILTLLVTKSSQLASLLTCIQPCTQQYQYMHINNRMFQNSIVVMHMLCTGIHHVCSKVSSADFTSDMHAVLCTTTCA